MNKQPSLRTIAEKTGFAVTTISKALNDAPNISAKTKAYVRQVADEMGYRPDRAGVSLRTGQTHKIVLLMQLSDEISDFSRQLILGMGHGLRATTYELVFQPVLPEQDQVEEVRSIIRNRSADGIVLAQTAPDDQRVALAIEHDFPVVTHGRTHLKGDHAFYDFDNDAFSYAAVKRLSNMGCASVGLFAPEPELTYFTHLSSGLNRANAQFDVQASYIDLSEQQGDYAERVRTYCAAAFAAGRLPRGLICSSELAALAAMDGVRRAGGEIGEDVHIVARKTSNLLDFVSPKIQWVSEDLIVAGEQLAALLLNRIKGASAADLQVIGAPTPSWSEN